MILTKTGFGYG